MNWSTFKDRVKALCYLDSTSPNPEVQSLFDQYCQQVAIDLQTRIPGFQDGHVTHLTAADAAAFGAVGRSFEFPTGMMTFDSLRVERFAGELPDAMVVEGAGSTGFNTYYLHTGSMFGGRKQYVAPGFEINAPTIAWLDSDEYWAIFAGMGPPAYAGSDASQTPDLVGEWFTSEYSEPGFEITGAPPAPTVRRPTLQELVDAGLVTPQYRSRSLSFMDWEQMKRFVEAEEPCPQEGTAPCFVWSTPEQSMRSFVLLPNLLTDPNDRLALRFNGVRDSFSNSDVVPFNSQAVTAAHYFVRGHLMLNHHEKRLIGQEFLQRYERERTLLYLDMKNRRESATMKK
jgi:hypothetical protein